MITRKSEQTIDIREHMRGGEKAGRDSQSKRGTPDESASIRQASV